MSTQQLRPDIPLLDVISGDIISLETTVAWEADTGKPAPLDRIGQDGVDTFTGDLTGIVQTIEPVNNGAGFQIALIVPADHRTYMVRTSRYNPSVTRVGHGPWDQVRLGLMPDYDPRPPQA